MAIETKTLNRIKRVLDQIESNAKKATPGPWGISHSHIIKYHEKGAYDVACRPWQRDQCVYGVNPYGTPTAADDMRYITTVNPKTMLELVADVRVLLLQKLGEDK